MGDRLSSSPARACLRLVVPQCLMLDTAVAPPCARRDVAKRLRFDLAVREKYERAVLVPRPPRVCSPMHRPYFRWQYPGPCCRSCRHSGVRRPPRLDGNDAFLAKGLDRHKVAFVHPITTTATRGLRIVAS